MPIYETQAHLRREEEFSRLVAEKFKCTFVKLPMRYGLDFAAIRNGKVVGFVELKVRGNPVGSYQTFMLSTHKFMSARALHDTTGLPCTLAVSWSDVWGYLPMANAFPDENGRSRFEIGFGGRWDRGDDQDVEPVFLIPTSEFTMVS